MEDACISGTSNGDLQAFRVYSEHKFTWSEARAEKRETN